MSGLTGRLREVGVRGDHSCVKDQSAADGGRQDTVDPLGVGIRYMVVVAPKICELVISEAKSKPRHPKSTSSKPPARDKKRSRMQHDEFAIPDRRENKNKLLQADYRLVV